MKRLIFSGLFFILLAVSVFAGEKATDFTLTDVQGNEHSLSDYKDAKAVVVMFIATRCPVSNAYNERMVELYNDFHDKGVVFLGINSNKMEDVEEVKKHADKHNFEFTVLKDPNNVIADRFDAKVTPETYVLDSNFNVLYHGRIDDSQDASDIEKQDLRNALDAVLDGESVPNAVTKAFGCSIKRVS